MNYKLILLLLGLSFGFTLSAQEPPSSRIEENGFWIVNETEWDSQYNPQNASESLYVEIETDGIRYERLTYTVGDLIKLVVSEGNTTNHEIGIGLLVDNQVLAMDFNNGNVTDELGNTLPDDPNLPPVTVEIWDVFYFKLIGGAVEYYKNAQLLKTVNITEQTTYTAFYGQDSQQNNNGLTVVFEIENGGNILASMEGVLSGQVYFPYENTVFATDPMFGMPEVDISITRVTSNEPPILLETNEYGDFSTDIFSGMVAMEASYITDDPTIGVNNDDVDILVNHISPISEDKILCPLFRIAADINQDGLINIDDLTALQAHVDNPNANDSPIANNWWFIPIPYAYPTDYHPDIPFTTQFWDLRQENASGDALPFTAMLRYNAKAYTYQEGAETKAWMNKLHEWMFDANPACNEVRWGFYMVRPGDLNGSSLSDIEFSTSD